MLATIAVDVIKGLCEEVAATAVMMERMIECKVTLVGVTTGRNPKRKGASSQPLTKVYTWHALI